MKNSQKVIFLLLIIITGLAVGWGMYIYNQNKPPVIKLEDNVPFNPDRPVSTNPAVKNSSNQSNISVAGMTKYTDQAFGFSFYYPSEWEVTSVPVTNINKYTDGAVKKELDLTFKDRLQVSLEEVVAPSLAVGDSTGVDGACPVCYPVHYYFDTKEHVWMSGFPVSGAHKAIISFTNTMGGLHMFPGSQRFGANTIIPLSAQNFVMVTVNGSIATTSNDPQALAKTIVATNPAVATPASASVQQKAVAHVLEAYN